MDISLYLEEVEMIVKGRISYVRAGILTNDKLWNKESLLKIDYPWSI